MIILNISKVGVTFRLKWTVLNILLMNIQDLCTVQIKAGILSNYTKLSIILKSW